MRLAFFIMAATAASLFSLPSGHKVKQGDVQVTKSEKELLIQSGRRAVVHWDKFSVDRGERARFQMKDSKSSVLNRVSGGERSDILGKLESNGKVYLLNPKGVLIGPEAQINVHSLVASTLDVLDEEYLNGNELRFFGSEKGSIVNMGEVEGHSVFLLAGSVENHGKIKAERVALATGNKILLQPKGEQRIFIEASGAEESIDNRGKIEALTTEIKNSSPYVLAVRSSGTIEATATEKRNGKIFLVADKGTVEVDGTLRASQVDMSGDQVYLYGNALIDAPEGKVNIGRLTPTRNVVLFPESKVTVSASEMGDAGEVYIYSEGATAHYGIIEACGGLKGGNGGFVELSGKMDLGLEGRIERGAPMGTPGELLIDPKNATITAAGGPLPTPSLTFGVSSAASLSITGASLGSALDSGPVTIE
ncbi:MAG: filamentous hemagglutinin N-terminal domain-containing protein [Candidatus Algichlamydia australiensis]|nr:filamentous hemagglutinin N-terminal domain-containing protein [Chlamydiales bacterium]